jgi:hypothetical protein
MFVLKNPFANAAMGAIVFFFLSSSASIATLFKSLG